MLTATSFVRGERMGTGLVTLRGPRGLRSIPTVTSGLPMPCSIAFRCLRRRDNCCGHGWIWHHARQV